MKKQNKFPPRGHVPCAWMVWRRSTVITLRRSIAHTKRPPRGRPCISLAERGGFEPPVGYEPTHAFQACDLNHSSTSPGFGFACAKPQIIAKLTPLLHIFMWIRRRLVKKAGATPAAPAFLLLPFFRGLLIAPVSVAPGSRDFPVWIRLA